MTLRPIVDSDRAPLREALVACGAFSEEEIRVAMEILDTAIRGGLDGDYPTFVAEIDGTARGYACAGKTPLTYSTWYLYWLCVHPGHQRSGVGRALLTHAEQFIAANGGQRLLVETSGRPDYASVRRFYELAGYVVVGNIPDFYKAHDDLVIYHRILAQLASPGNPPPDHSAPGLPH